MTRIAKWILLSTLALPLYAAEMSTAADDPCQAACQKAYDCHMVGSPTACYCPPGSAAASPQCAACWTSHSCDDLRHFACTQLSGPCN